jgi:integrase
MKNTRLFPSGRPMPANLYKSTRWTEDNQTYRYKFPNGQYKSLALMSESDVILFAEDANESLAGTRCGPESPPQEIKMKGTIGSLLSKWISEVHNKRGTKECTKKAGRSHLTCLRPIEDMEVGKITRKDFKKCWDNLNAIMQYGAKPHLRAFTQSLLDDELCPLLDGRNPFWSIQAGGFSSKEVPPKARGILTWETFNKIKEVAAKKGFHHLVVAMDISYLTYFRISDVCGLQNSHIKDGCLLEKTLQKTESEGRKAEVKTYRIGENDTHKELGDAIRRARKLTINLGCPYLIQYKTRNGKRDQYKVLPASLNYAWRVCIEEISGYKGMSTKNYPTFHEIRALRAYQDKKSGRSIDDISKDMGHTNISITLKSYDTHEKYNKSDVAYAPSLSPAAFV